MADFTGLKANAKLGFGIGIGLLVLGLLISLLSGLFGKVRG